jgi:hypothetical protein
MARRTTATLLLLLAALCAPAEALRFYVNQTTGDNRRSHVVAQDSSTPWKTITHALQMAHILTEGRPHVIEIAAGSYSPSAGETMPFVINQTGIYLQSQGGVSLNGQHQTQILQVNVPSSDFVLRNFSLINGRADLGGAVACTSCTLRVVDSILLGNESTVGGDAIYVKDGRLQLNNNILRVNGSSMASRSLIEVRNTFADTTKRDVIRNNTFYRNTSPQIFTTGNRTDISSNIFVGISGAKAPAIIDSAAGLEPHVRYNLFWETDILYLSADRDSIKVARTVRDTLTLAEQGVAVPSFVTNVPDTVAKVGSLYEYDVGVTGTKSSYKFTVINSSDIPVGMDEALIESSGILRWTPTADQAGTQHAVRVEIIRQTPPVTSEFLSYLITAFTAADFPDTTTPADVITVSTTPDTSGAVDSLNTIVPVFSTAASSGGNAYGDPLFLNTAINRFELQAERVRTIVPAGDTLARLDTLRTLAIDKGIPVARYNDASLSGGQVRNDMGRYGGPTSSGPPSPGTHTERSATGLPDSVAVEGQTWTYDPQLDPSGDILIIDLIQGPPTMGAAFGSGDGKSIPATWVPALQDTGKYLVGVESFFPGGSARHYFPLRVRAANARPRFTTTPPDSTIEDTEFVYAIGAVDDDGHSLSWSVDNGPDSLTVDDTGTVRWTPRQADVGTANVVIAVVDSIGASNTQAFTLTVVNTNDAPVVTGLADTTIVEDVAFVLPLSATDEDPADSIFTFGLVAGPDSAAVDSLGRFLWTPRQVDVGRDTVTISAADAAGASGSASFVITVTEVDDPPTISSAPDTVGVEDSLYVYAATAIDEEGGAIAWSLPTAPQGMTIDTLGVVRWTPALADTGRHDVTLQVADPGGQTASQSWQLRIDEVNDAPVILSRTPADTLVLLDPGEGVSFSIDVEDEEGDNVTLQWLVDGTQRSTQATFLHVPDTTSADTVTLNLSDGTNTTSTMWIVDARAIAKISVATDTLDFGNVVLGDTASVTLRVRNPGRTTLTIANLQVGNLAYTAVFGSDAIALRDSTTLQIRYLPTSRGERLSSVQFSTNDPDAATVTIPLRGVGVVPTTAVLDANPATGDQGVREALARVGESVSVDVEIQRGVSPVTAAVQLSFDTDVLTFESYSADAATTNLLGAGISPTVTQPSAGTVRVDLIGSASAEDGTLGRFTFAVAEDASTDATTAVGLDLVEIRSSGIAQADALTGLEGVLFDVAPALQGDGNGDGVINFDDFFLFADDFGTFNGAARPLALPRGDGAAGLVLRADERPGDARSLEVALDWRSDEPLRGAVVVLSWDPTVLRFEEARSPREGEVLTWARPLAEGRIELAAAPTQGRPLDSALGVLRFARLDGDATEVRGEAAFGRDADGVTAPLASPAAAPIAALPRVATLFPAHPNPFNPETVIPFYVPSGLGQSVHVRVYDLLGRVVQSLVSEPLEGGHHRVIWRGRDDQGRPAGAGVYLVELRAGDRRQVRKVLLLK